MLTSSLVVGPRFFLALLLAAPAAAEPSVPPTGPGVLVEYEEAAPQRGFLDPDSIDAVQLFPPAPAPGSEADRADFAELFAWQARRSPAECARAQAETSPSYENLFGRLSPYPLPLDLEETAFFLALAGDAGAASEILKRRYKRPRPFLRDAALVPCITRPKGWAYPSGHATIGRLWALVLSDLAPARAPEFMARGDEAGLDRVIGGVHHPSDVAAGRRLAEGLYEQLKLVPQFRKAMAAMRRRLGATEVLAARP